MNNQKKKFSKLLGTLAAVLLLAGVMPQMLPNVNAPVKVQAAKGKINAKKLTLTKGQSKTLKVKGAGGKAVWSSSKKRVAKVNRKGKVTAMKAGKAIITAKVGSQEFQCRVTVEAPELSSKSLQLSVGESSVLKLRGTRQKVQFSSSNQSVASVTARGRVTARKSGSARITAKAGGKKYTCLVWVYETPNMETRIELPGVDTYIEGANFIVHNRGNLDLIIEGSIILMNPESDYLILTLGNEDNWFDWDTVGPGQTMKYILDSEEAESFWIEENDVLLFQIEYDGIQYMMVLDTSGNIINLMAM